MAKDKQVKKLLIYCRRIQPSSLHYKIVKVDGNEKIRMTPKS